MAADTITNGAVPNSRRREFLTWIGAAGFAGLAGCVSDIRPRGVNLGGGVTIGGAAKNVKDAQQAVVRIVTQSGSETSDAITTGAGSGFIIDPSGIAVTAYHVVAGSASRSVFIGGGQKAYNATILGVSECADLAVLDIEGGDFTFLEWYDGQVSPGLDVWSLGFPGGDPSYTITQGKVQVVRPHGENYWASIDSQIEHTTNTEGGISGGPLVTENARVVGIEYAGIEAVQDFANSQNFSIGVAAASPIVQQLRKGTDTESIGISGQAVPAQGQSPAGVFVSAVESGSPANKAGIEAEDIIVRLENLPIGGQTMKSYCDVIQNSASEDVLAVEVYRPSTAETLQGEINGNELEPVPDIEVPEEETETTSSNSYSDYTTLTDDQGVIEMTVPVEWSDVDGRPTDLGPDIAAAPDLESFYETFETPGIRVFATTQLGTDPDAVLDEYALTGCGSSTRSPYESVEYTGKSDEYSPCGDAQSTVYTIAAVPEDESHLVFVLVQLVDDRDWEALDRISYDIVGEV